MRNAVILLLLLPWASVGAESGGVVIAELQPDAAGGREFIELWNQGEATSLAGWAIEDAVGNRFDFSDEQLAAGGRLVVWGGGTATPEGPAWTKASVWNNGGDTAYLYHGEALVDTFSYGSAGGPALPEPGQSLALVGGSWEAGDPTPGRAPGSQGGSASVEIVNAPPHVWFGAVPAQARPGEQVSVTWQVSDPNGDPVSWTLTSDGALVAEGGEGDHEATLTAPTASPWILRLDATDGDGAANASATIHIRSDGLRVALPPEGIWFPAIAPGATNVSASAAFTIQNDDGSPITPRIDIADFSGPSSFASQGRLSLLIDGHSFAYDSPLTALPELAPGMSLDVVLRLDQVPMPLPAGTYGTTFTVVA